MRVPTIRGVIDRRILANYRIDPDVMARQLPAPFRPKLLDGYAVGGICMIRLRGVRPKFLPAMLGIGSENAAHRVAVEWEEQGSLREGVYIPRRDTNSRLNALMGGRVFPGLHHLAEFSVHESEDRFTVSMRSRDGGTHAHVSGRVTGELPASSLFPSLASASDFFESGSLGYSDTGEPGRFDGLELRCRGWHVDALAIDRVESSYFENKELFPAGSVDFDCALLMRDIEHEWHGRGDLCCP